MTATVARGAGPFDFKWSMSCEGNDSVGVFTPQTQIDVAESLVTFKPGNITLANCILRVNVEDFCHRKNFDTKILGITGYHPPLGFHNITHHGEDFSSTGDKDTIDTKHPVNSLYTQISNKAFNVSIVSLAADKETLLKKDGNVILELIDTSNVTDEKPDSCANAGWNGDGDITDKIEITSNGGHFKNSHMATAINISYANALQNVGFRVSYVDLPLGGDTHSYSYGIPSSMSKEDLDNRFPDCSAICTVSPSNWDCYKCISKSKYLGGYGEAVCSRDNFVIRPASFDLSLEGTEPFYGGREYPFKIDAVNNSGTPTSGYTDPDLSNPSLFLVGQTGFIDSNLTLPDGCDLNTTLQTWQGGDVKFMSGEGFEFIDDDNSNNDSDKDPLLYTYNNVGDVNITAYETTWALADMDKNPSTLEANHDDCIVDSGSNIAVDGKVGCMVMGIYSATFLPSRFINVLDVQNFKAGSFTYLAEVENNSSNMYGEIALSTRAVLEDNSTATNYTAGCYAKDINSSVSFIEPSPTLDPYPLAWGPKLEDRIKIFVSPDSNTTLKSITPGIAIRDFNSSESTFTHGLSNVSLRFNFDRHFNEADNPFDISNAYFNVNVTDGTTNGLTLGSDINASTESNATFYYARANASQDIYQATGSTIQTPIVVEIYCSFWAGCTALGVNTGAGGQTDDNKWWLSTSHSETHGDGNITLQRGNFLGNSWTVNSDVNVQTAGKDSNINVTAGDISIPSTVTVNLDTTNSTDTNGWLIYHKDSASDIATNLDPFYQVDFTSTSGWAGVGDTGYILDINASNTKTKRLNW